MVTFISHEHPVVRKQKKYPEIEAAGLLSEHSNYQQVYSNN